MTVQELKKLVEEKGYGTALYDNVNGEPVYLSRGVREIFFGNGDMQDVITSVRKFQNGDFGDAAAHGKGGQTGHEYGRYQVGALAGEDNEDAGLWIHRDGEAIIVYYSFER